MDLGRGDEPKDKITYRGGRCVDCSGSGPEVRVGKEEMVGMGV